MLQDWLGFVCCQGCVVGPNHLVLCLYVLSANAVEFSRMGISNIG